MDPFTKLSSSHLAGEIGTEREGEWLLLTVPYSDEWRITVNGKRTAAEKVMDALTAVPLEKGENRVEMKFVPRGFTAGAVISVLSLLIAAAVPGKQRKHAFLRK